MMTTVRIAISATLLGFLLWVVDLNNLGTAVASVPFSSFAGATCAIAATVLPFAWRWQILSRVNGVDLGYGNALLATTHAYFFNQALVSTLGGDTYRVLYLTRREHKLKAALSSVLADRLVGLFGMLALVIVGLPILVGTSDNETVHSIALGVGIAILAGLTILKFLPLTLLNKGRRQGFKWVTPIANALQLLHAPAQQRALLHGMLLAIAGQLLLCTAVWLLAQGLTLDLSWWLVLFGFPPAYFVSLIPITVGGWGTREGAMLTTMGLLGMAATNALALSVLFGLCMLLMGIMGGLCFAVSPSGTGGARLPDNRG